MPRLTRPALEPLEDRLLLSTIHGTLYDDRDGDGARDAGEPAAAGRVVFLDTDRDGVLDASERRTTTTADGAFSFANLPAGRYQVAQIPPAGWRATAPVLVNALDATPDGGRLIGMDRFRDDPRFADIDGRGFAVAVIDTGLASHPYFPAGSVAAQYDFVSADAVADDGGGHGTIVSSIIGSRNSTYPGIAPGVKLIGLKVLDAAGNGDFSDIERGLQWVLANASEHNIIAVNLSLGDAGSYTSKRSLYGLGDELAALAARGITVVAAAGNEYGPGKTPGLGYPGIDPNVLPAGAVWDANHGGPWEWTGDAVDTTTAPDRIVSFSQRLGGSGMLFAPGTLLVGANPGGGTAEESGTSVAAAVISGSVALAQQVARDRLGRLLSVNELKQFFQQTGDVIRDGDDEADNVTNTGASFRRLDVPALADVILAKGSISPSGRASAREVSLGAGQTVWNVRLGSRRDVVVNAAPILNGDGPLTSVPEDTGHPVGITALGLLAGHVSDRDAAAQRGIAVVESTGRGWGRWQYSLDAGRTWIEMGVVSSSQALLLPGLARVRFMPNANANGNAVLRYHAWDRTHGAIGSRVNLTLAGATGGTTAFSVATARARFEVRAINDSPILTGPGHLADVAVNAVPPGSRILDMLAGTVIDPDGASPTGLAIVGTSGVGRWQYSRNGGSTWLDLGAMSPSRARLLGPADRVRFVPAHGWRGRASITYRAWDRTFGAAGSVIDLALWSKVGGRTAFSKQLATAGLEVG